VEAFGAVITIGGTCRHTGAFEVTNLEGRFDLAALVDPRIKSPAAADKARIKALVSLTGVEASVNMFRGHEAFEDFDTVVTGESLATDDLIEMAARIKASYDEAALKSERLAEREFGQSTALIPASDVDLDAEDDATVLQEAYNAARDEVTRLAEQARNADSAAERLQKAQECLEDLGENELTDERDQLLEFLSGADEEDSRLFADLEHLMEQARKVRAELDAHRSEKVRSENRVKSIDRQLAQVAQAKKELADSAGLERPSEQDIADAKEELQRAANAIEIGVKVRAAKQNASKSQLHRKAAQDAQDRAGRYRDAGKATDEVLSGCIKCPQLRVESDGKSARLVTDHQIRGAGIPYHDLSDGEKWTIAIDIGADQVGEGGLLVISQVGWEGIDGANRIAIHEHAVKRGVYILTAEASADPAATREIVPTPMGRVTEVKKPQPRLKAPPEPGAPVESIRATKPEPTKPLAETKAKPKPAANPVVTDDDDIPF